MTIPSSSSAASNFGFVGAVFPRLLVECRAVEAAAVGNPRGSAMHARYVAEQVVRHIVAFHGWEIEGTFADLTHDPRFRDAVPSNIQSKIHAVRKIGNVAAHESGFFDPRAAIRCVSQLYDLMVWAAANVSGQGRAALPTQPFDEALLHAVPKQKAASASELRKLEAELEARETEALQLSEEAARLRADREAHLREEERFKERAAADAAELEELRAELEKARAALAERTRLEMVAAQEEAGAVDTSASFVISEADTRRDIIDPMLAEAGFSKARGNLREEVALSCGKADYVLYGSDGKPLAVVEAKKTSVSISAGKEQARQYADALEAQYGLRPIIYYTNGHIVHMWDDAAGLPVVEGAVVGDDAGVGTGVGAGAEGTFGYQAREVEGYATEDELYGMIAKRGQRKALASVPHDPAIAGQGRPYQELMIRAVTEHYASGHRRALLVMATGTGKTRVAIALVKLLKQAGWVKNVLFLADRRALVNQAAKNFRAHYEEAGIVNLLDNPNGSGDVYLSTYPTIVNLMRTRFSPYAFDLIIIDEAHRSVYRRYKRIFEYFDSLLLGLTATPRNEIDHNTYSLFNLADGAPTGNFGLKEGIEGGYLVPFRVFKADSVIMRSGVRYEDLSDEEKLAWDDKDWGTDEDGEQLSAPESVAASEINAKLYNIATIDNVIRQVLENGIKVAGADRMGKTIFFARNQHHAELIQSRLAAAAPALRSEIITSASSRKDDLIEAFEAVGPGAIDIAVSVDMLDTGIDVPEVVNLVFFKPVHSQTKFWQMIGRGTRTCADLLGEGLDKQEFFVFDYCDNMGMFTGEVVPGATEGSGQRPLSERMFLKRLHLIENLPEGAFRDSLRTMLRGQLRSVPDNSPLIRPSERPYLERFRLSDSWESMNAADFADIEDNLAHLPFESAKDDEYAKRFDLLILAMQEKLVGRELLADVEEVTSAELIGEGPVDKVKRIAAHLLTKMNVPAIVKAAPRLEEAADATWWESVTIDDLELLRIAVRDLVRYVDRGSRNVVTMDIADELGDLEDVTPVDFTSEGTVVESSVEQKIREALEAHGDSLVLQKIRKAQPLTNVDVANLEHLVASAGDADDLESQLGVSLPRFVRGLVGLEEAAARAAFADMMEGTTLTAVQLSFMEKVIGGLVQNGIVTMAELFDAPYDDYGSPFDVFDGQAATVTDIHERLKRIESSVEPVSS